MDNREVVGEVVGEDDEEVLGAGVQASRVLAQCKKRSLISHRWSVFFLEAHLHHSLSMPLITHASSLSMQLPFAVVTWTEVDACSTNRVASDSFIFY